MAQMKKKLLDEAKFKVIRRRAEMKGWVTDLDSIIRHYCVLLSESDQLAREWKAKAEDAMDVEGEAIDEIRRIRDDINEYLGEDDG